MSRKGSFTGSLKTAGGDERSPTPGGQSGIGTTSDQGDVPRRGGGPPRHDFQGATPATEALASFAAKPPPQQQPPQQQLPRSPLLGVEKKGSGMSTSSAIRSKTETLPPRSPLKFPGQQSPAATSFEGLQGAPDTAELTATQPAPTPPLERTASGNSLGQRRLSQRSGASGQEVPPIQIQRTSSQGSRFSRQGSAATQQQELALSHRIPEVTSDQQSERSEGSAPPPPPPPPPATVPAEDSVVELQQKNRRLQDQVASLQRLMQDNTLAFQVKKLKEEVQHKAKIIKRLEEEKVGLREENARLKEAGRLSMRGSRKVSRPPSSVGGEDTQQLINEQKKEIRELEKRLQTSDHTADQVVELQESVCHLRQSVAEKEVALQMAHTKLGRAQDAIIAGISWEKEVKLTETKKALQKLLDRSPSPQPFRSTATSAMRSATMPVPHPSTALPPPPLSGHRSSPSASSVTVVDVSGREVLFAPAPGEAGVCVTFLASGYTTPPLAHLVYLPGTCELRFGGNAVVLPRDDAQLMRIAMLADSCGCRHNILGAPVSTPSRAASCVVAAHWVNRDRSTSPRRHGNLFSAADL